MGDTSIAVTAGSGTLLHTWSRTISAATVHDEFVLPGEYPYASYTISAGNVSIATSSDHVLQIMAGSSLNVRVRRIWIEQTNNATTVTVTTFQLFRLTSAGTGGTSLTPQKLDTADGAAGCTAMTLPSSKGTEAATELRRAVIISRQAVAATATQPEEAVDWDYRGTGNKSLIIAAGTSNGLAVKITNGVAAATYYVYADVVETNFV